MEKCICDLCFKREKAGLCLTLDLKAGLPGSYSHSAFKEENLSGGPNFIVHKSSALEEVCLRPFLDYWPFTKI